MKYLSIACIFFSFLFVACSEQSEKQLTETKLLSIQNRDTLNIKIIENKSEKRFFGSYKLNKPGDEIVIGDIQGNIKGDSLIGDLYYTPFGWKDKKRKPFALLKQKNGYLLGHGTEQVYMGIPYYIPGTIRFDSTSMVLKTVAGTISP